MVFPLFLETPIYTRDGLTWISDPLGSLDPYRVGRIVEQILMFAIFHSVEVKQFLVKKKWPIWFGS